MPVAAGDLAGRRQIALGRHDDAVLALHGFEDDERGVRGDGGAERLRVAVRHMCDVAGQRLERRAASRAGRSGRGAPIVRPWKPPSVATMWVRPVSRPILNAASTASAPELQK